MQLFLLSFYLFISNTAVASILYPPPASILEIFKHKPLSNELTMNAIAPGDKYKDSPSEKDKDFSKSHSNLRFTKIKIKLHKKMPLNTVMVDFSFIDKNSNQIIIPNVNILRMIPKIDNKGNMSLPELLLEEFERTGNIFRREHNEYQFKPNIKKNKQLNNIIKRTYRAAIWNNCLDAGKWEFTLSTKEEENFEHRLESKNNLNQKRLLSQAWFYIDHDLYRKLFALKNNGYQIDQTNDYELLSKNASKVKIDFSKLTRNLKQLKSKTTEIGHRSKKIIKPLDTEQFLKIKKKLFINYNEGMTYNDISKRPITLAQFTSRGFYDKKKPKSFDLSWLKKLIDIKIYAVDTKISSTFINLILSGKNSPYTVTIGNIDLSKLSEQKYLSLPFGFNPYPKSRRHNKRPDTTSFDSDTIPREIMPFLLLTSKKDQLWVNNQKKGIEKVAISWKSIDKKEIEIYLISYERITPVWTATVELENELIDKTYIKSALYNY